MIDIKCGICGERIDRGACGQTYGVHTTERDENEKHTQERIYLCGHHNLMVELYISDQKRQRESSEA